MMIAVIMLNIIALIAMIFALFAIDKVISSRASRLEDERQFNSYFANLLNLNSSPYEAEGISDLINTSSSDNSDKVNKNSLSDGISDADMKKSDIKQLS